MSEPEHSSWSGYFQMISCDPRQRRLLRLPTLGPVREADLNITHSGHNYLLSAILPPKRSAMGFSPRDLPSYYFAGIFAFRSGRGQQYT